MNKIINMDCLAGLKTLPEKCVNTCVTSPPYFGLRSYLPDVVRLKNDTPQCVKDELIKRGILPIDHTAE